MALSMNNYKLDSGLIATNSYIRIDSISGDKTIMILDVKMYANQQAFSDGRAFVDHKVYRFIPNVDDNATNYHKQGYEYLKTLEEYTYAIDVLEPGQSPL